MGKAVHCLASQNGLQSVEAPLSCAGSIWRHHMGSIKMGIGLGLWHHGMPDATTLLEYIDKAEAVAGHAARKPLLYGRIFL